jgi:hypothetical protein
MSNAHGLGRNMSVECTTTRHSDQHYMVFIDEAGYCTNWTNQRSLQEQPVFVLAGICIPAANYRALCDDFRQLAALVPEGIDGKNLGQGAEVKASDVINGTNYWRGRDDLRNQYRDTMLCLPAKHGGKAIVVALDKKAHKEGREYPWHPYEYAPKLLCERIQLFCANRGDSVVADLTFDRCDHERDRIDRLTSSLRSEGSKITTRSANGIRLRRTIKIDRITRVSHANSSGSHGLQIADFYASYTYKFLKHRREGRLRCDWWSLIWENLDSPKGAKIGGGLKLEPSGAWEIDDLQPDRLWQIDQMVPNYETDDMDLRNGEPLHDILGLPENWPDTGAHSPRAS